VAQVVEAVGVEAHDREDGSGPRGQVLALRWTDVDWLASRIRVRRNYVRGEFVTPKSCRSTRSVPMAREVAVALERLSATTERSGAALVFGHLQTGEPLRTAGVRRRFKRALTPAGPVKRARWPRR
jgi:integrase